MGWGNTFDRVTGWVQDIINFGKRKKRDNEVSNIKKGVSSHNDDSVSRIMHKIEDDRNKRASRR